MYAVGDVGAVRYCETKRYTKHKHIHMRAYIHTYHELSLLLCIILSPTRSPLTPCVQVTKDLHEEETFQKEKTKKER